MAEVTIIKVSRDLLPAYADACRRGWSRDNIGLEKTARADLEKIATDPEGFAASLDDPDGKGAPITLPDGTQAKRLPGYLRAIWDGEFAGSISFRWQPGTAELPPHVLGHIGYAVAPWKRRRGYATAALGLILKDACAMGLPYVTLTTLPDNPASQRVITKNGGVMIERFNEPEAYGGHESLRWRIDL